jgi:voltage-gated potassium channel
MFFRFNAHLWHIIWIFKSVFFAQILLIVAGAGLITYVEQLPFGESLYFAFVTGLTIGYGDIVATTAVGRIISILLGIIGILFSGLVVAVAVKAVGQAWQDIHGTD